MIDLISRESILTELNEEGNPYSIDIPLRDTDTPKDIVNKTLKAYRTVLIQMVNDIPTAYDVDKVIERIEASEFETAEEPHAINTFRVIEIIKKGAVKDELN